MNFLKFLYLRSSLWKEAQIQQHNSLQKELCEAAARKQYRNSDSHAFLDLYIGFKFYIEL